MIISILNQKGGVGKTTLVVHLAIALAMKRKKVLVVDADPQGSALDWANNREIETSVTIIGLPKATLHKELPKLIENYDVILIDGSPRVYDVARSAIMASDIVLIPIQPSPFDVWAAKEIVDLTNEVLIFKENLKTFFIINRKIVNTAIGRDVKKAIAEYELPVLKTEICQRVNYAESIGTGQTVTETEPKSLAAKEIDKLTKEILKIIKK